MIQCKKSRSASMTVDRLFFIWRGSLETTLCPSLLSERHNNENKLKPCRLQ